VSNWRSPFWHCPYFEKQNPGSNALHQGFFFVANFRHLMTKKKKRLANPTKGFLRIFFKKFAISRGKKEVKSRQI
jgi:hypothetical protein